jgi:predicted nucleic acid-binding protein
MEWLKRLHGTIVGLDIAPLIYFIEKSQAYLTLVYPFFAAMQEGEIHVVTSTLTLTEVLVQPYRRADHDLVREYSEILLKAPNLTLIPVSATIAEDAARLRASMGLKTPDAIQVASALAGHASTLLTNDSRFKAVGTLQPIVLSELLQGQHD